MGTQQQCVKFAFIVNFEQISHIFLMFPFDFEQENTGWRYGKPQYDVKGSNINKIHKFVV